MGVLLRKSRGGSFASRRNIFACLLFAVFWCLDVSIVSGEWPMNQVTIVFFVLFCFCFFFRKINNYFLIGI